MAKNKDRNISPSKGISIVIKNDTQQPLIKPKKKRKYERINVLPRNLFASTASFKLSLRIWPKNDLKKGRKTMDPKDYLRTLILPHFPSRT